jgi:hypothetical protein
MAATETAQPENTVEVLEPAANSRTVKIGLEPQITYVQKPLSFFQKLEVFSVLGGALDKAMSGPDGLTIGQLFDGPSSMGSDLSAQNFRDADTFIKAIVKLVQYAPDLLADLYLVILGVPRGERYFVKEMMELPEDQGGLSDEDGLGILETFVDQNWDVMVDFFTSKAIPLFQKISNKVQESQPSKPSKNTQPTTRKK